MVKKTSVEELPGNRKLSRKVAIRPDPEGEVVEEKKVTRKSLRRPPVRKKKPLFLSILGSIMGEDTGDVGRHIVEDVLVPAAKSTISDMVTTGIERLLFGESRPRKRDRDDSRVSYGSYYKNRDRDDDRGRKHQIVSRGRFNLKDIYFRYGDDAAEVLDELTEIAEKYGQVSVADYFDAAEIEGKSWTHDKWGWDEELISEARCTHTRHGYAIMLPDPIELDD